MGRRGYFLPGLSFVVLAGVAACGGGGFNPDAFPGVAPSVEVLTFTPDPLDSEAPRTFVMEGRGFGPAGSTAEVAFEASAGTPFAGGTTAREVVIARIVTAERIQGTTPRFGLQADEDATVAVTFPDGSRVWYGGSGHATVRIRVPRLPEQGMWTTPGPGDELLVLVEGADPDDENPVVELTARIGTPFDGGESRVLVLEGIWQPPDLLAVPMPVLRLFDEFDADVTARFGTGAVARGAFVRCAPGIRVSASDTTTEDEFGLACAVDTGAAVFGAPLAESAYVHERGHGAWSSAARLRRASAGTDERFGAAVDVSGDAVAVGAPGRRAAYVFRRGASGWSQEEELLPALAGVGFGGHVALDGDLLAVAEHSDPGRVFLYRRGTAGWSVVHSFRGYDTVSGDGFARRVAANEDSRAVAVGAPFDDDRGTDSGAVYVEEETGGFWGFAAKVVPTAGAAGDNFGFDVAMDTHLLVVGAPGDTSPAHNGAVYVFRRVGSTWVQEAKLLPPPGAPPGLFGLSVAVDGMRVVVGAPSDVLSTHGRIYVYERDGGTWPLRATLDPWWASPYAPRLGVSVDVSGFDVVGGVPASEEKGSGCIY